MRQRCDVIVIVIAAITDARHIVQCGGARKEEGVHPPATIMRKRRIRIRERITSSVLLLLFLLLLLLRVLDVVHAS